MHNAAVSVAFSSSAWRVRVTRLRLNGTAAMPMLTLRRDGYGWRVPPHYYSHTLTINPATCSITHTCLIKWLSFANDYDYVYDFTKS